MPGVIITDLQGNEFQTDVQYRGFESSPLNGVPQGLAIYQNGVRINEAFGDIINWDFLPAIAINDIAVVSGNPVFGLNALGGAIVIGMKDGFNYQGAEIDVRGGSFGRAQVAAEAGQRSGGFGAYIATEAIHDSGWREFSPAEIRRTYADLGAKGDGVELHVNYTRANNFVGAVTAAPVQLLDLGRNRVYTNPQTTNNDVSMVSANGSIKATDTLSLSGVTYFRHFRQSHIDANVLDAVECAPPGSNLLCIEDDTSQAFGEGPGTNPGGSIPFNIASPLATVDHTSQDAESAGGSVQAVDKAKLFGLPNQFLAGASYDHGRVKYGASSDLGVIGDEFVVSDLGILLTAPDDLAPRRLITTNDYYGFYVTDTLDLSNEFALTFGGRYNIAQLTLEDETGSDPFINGSHTYYHFNPVVGGTYKVAKGLSLYGGFSEANRAPTPAELACADPTNPRLIESFLTGDPPLKQVVSQTFEAGVRGERARSALARSSSGASGYFTRSIWTTSSASPRPRRDAASSRTPATPCGRASRQASPIRPTAFTFTRTTTMSTTFRDQLILPSPPYALAGGLQLRRRSAGAAGQPG